MAVPLTLCLKLKEGTQLMAIYTPYFYIIQDIRNGMYYAGSKYGKDANPDNFMIEGGYTTSSNIIKELINQHGLHNFTVRKIRIFETGPEAHRYETRFLQKINAKNHLNFYNKHNNDGIRPLSSDEMKEIINNKYGVDHVMHVPEIKQRALENLEKTLLKKYNVRHNFAIPEVRKTIMKTVNERYGVDYYSQTYEWYEKTKIMSNEKYGVDWPSQSEEVKERIILTNNEKYGVNYWAQTDEAKEILREANKTQFLDPVKKEKHLVASTENNPAKGTIWINKNCNNKRINPSLLKEYENEGWVKGRFIEKENAFWDYNKTGSNNPFFGKKHKKDTLDRISQSNKEKFEDFEYKENHRNACLKGINRYITAIVVKLFG